MVESAQPQRLTRSLTIWLAVLYGLGVTIGAGIYVLVGIAAGRSAMHAPLAFVFAALVMSFRAASFAELGTRMPVSASEAAYVEKAFSRPWLSLNMGLLVVLTATISATTISALASQGNLPQVLAHLNARTGTPLLATALGAGAILMLALAVPLSGLADLTARFTLVIFAIINITLIRIKSRETSVPLHVFVCLRWVPVAGLVSSIGLLLLDLVVS